MEEAERFAGQVVMISGATGGFGRALAQRFSQYGCRLSLSDIDSSALDALLNELIQTHGIEGVAVAGDIADPSTSEQWMAATVAKFDRVDIAINNAGTVAPFSRIMDTDVTTAQHIFAVDAMGVFYAMREQLLQMEAQLPRGGAIVNMASVAGLVGAPGLGVYAAAKHAVVGLSKTAALEHARRDVRVNAVCPSFARTAMVSDNLDADNPEAEKHMVRGVPMARLAEVDEVVRVVCFACDPANSFMTGQSLAVDGGICAG